MEATIYHTPVLLRETLSFLLTSPDGLYVDCTLGGGGHAEAILQSLRGGRLIGFDRDDEAVTEASDRLRGYGQAFEAVRGSFGEVASRLSSMGVAGVHGLLLDLGVSSHQLDDPDRGFSFQQNSPLDMRMDRSAGMSALDVVNTYSEELLSSVLRNYGEERDASRIAKTIVRKRPITTTGALADAVCGGIQSPQTTKTLARVFQAIRIEVNKELDELHKVLMAGPALLVSGGRVAVLTYHSLEDRIVKDFFRSHSATRDASVSKFLPDKILHPDLRILTRKPVTAGDKEKTRNPRARSAKLRVAEKL